ncbi:MAG: serine--tRNA ligase, partial [Gammaproteobacteria bacterium]|nr:serine--tRNA ligase [Gammaproteobacteria bacterium]
MLDIKLLRDNIDAVAKALLRRGFKLDTQKFTELENKRKSLQVRTQELQNQRNTQAKQIGMAKAKGEDITTLLSQSNSMGEELKSAEAELAIILADLDNFLAGIPNILDNSVPDKQEIIRTWGEP